MLVVNVECRGKNFTPKYTPYETFSAISFQFMPLSVKLSRVS